jgi:hypothetical protein
MSDPISELKPCPFCGGEAKIHAHHSGLMFHLTHRCPVIGLISIDWTSYAERLAQSWNTRHGEQTGAEGGA